MKSPGTVGVGALRCPASWSTTSARPGRGPCSSSLLQVTEGLLGADLRDVVIVDVQALEEGLHQQATGGVAGVFVSGKARANTVKALVITDPAGRLLFCGQARPGAIHDLTQVRQAGRVELLTLIPGVVLLADAGYQGLSTQTAGAVITPRPARRQNQIPVFPAPAAVHEPNAGLTRRSASAWSTASAT
jgi:DDE superfamily endonuclease